MLQHSLDQESLEVGIVIGVCEVVEGVDANVTRPVSNEDFLTFDDMSDVREFFVKQFIGGDASYLMLKGKCGFTITYREDNLTIMYYCADKDICQQVMKVCLETKLVKQAVA